MIQSRNLTTHTYNESTAAQIVEAILDTYFAEFQALQTNFGEFERGGINMKSCAQSHAENGLPESVLQKIRAAFVRYPQVEKAVLYGSRAKGTYKTGSDIDLTLRGGDDLTLNVLCKIANDLDDLYLPYTIDLSIFHDISDPDVIGHIQRVGVTVYERN